jgi:hypothetical protein
MKLNELRILIQEIIAEETIAEAANEVKPDNVEFKFDPIEDKIKEMLFSNGAYLDGNLRVEKKISPIQRKARLNNVLKQLENYVLYFKTSIAKQEDSFIADKEKYNKVWSDGDTLTNEGIFGPSKSAKFKTRGVNWNDLVAGDYIADGLNVGEISIIISNVKQGFTLKRVWTNDKKKKVGEEFFVSHNHDAMKDHPNSIIQVLNFVEESVNEGFFGPSKKDIADFEAELEALIKDKKLENAPDLEKMKEKVRATAKTSGFKGGKLGYQAAGTNKRTGNKIAPQFYYSTDSTTTGR